MGLKRFWLKDPVGMVIRLTCSSWIISKLICYKLWLADRLFPLVPVHGSLSSLPGWLHGVLFVLSLACMLILLLFPNKKTAIVLVVLEITSCLLDQNRWQPWEYQFIFMVAASFLYKDQKHTIVAWQLIIAALYFFSGISKLNSGFIHDTWQYLVLQRWLGINHPGTWIARAGYGLPLLEICAGLALLLNKTRRLAVYALIAMHLFILLLLGPAGLNINPVIWPWNLMMCLVLPLLFYHNSFHADRTFAIKPITWLTLACWWIMPWTRFAGYWDKYLSAVLFSGGVEQLFICTDDPKAAHDLAAYYDKPYRFIPCSPALSVYQWGIKEMHTPPYPESRVFKAIMLQWKQKYPHARNRFYIFKPGFAARVTAIEN